VLAPLGEATIVALVGGECHRHALTLRRPPRLEMIADRLFAVVGRRLTA
jgi:hypothetical protein